MPETFQNISGIVQTQDTFQVREVGITHPDTPGYIRLLNNGSIEIIAENGLGIVLDADTNSIVLIGEAIQFLTRDAKGLVWNNLAFNSQATTFSQPTFTSLDPTELTQMFEGVDQFFQNSPPLPTAKSNPTP